MIAATAFFADWLPFLPPNQKHQNTEWLLVIDKADIKQKYSEVATNSTNAP